jgi:hypothetical protein
MVQEESRIDWSASREIAVKEYLTDVEPADYVLLSMKVRNKTGSQYSF